MTSKFLNLVCFISIFIAVSSGQDYYWRNFNGTVPTDALIGSENFGYNQYIGRGPVDTVGLFMGPIVPGTDRIILTTSTQILTIYNQLEILSSDKPSNFTWVRVNSTSVSAVPGLVRAGYFFTGLAEVYVGRIRLSGDEYAFGHVNQIDYLLYYSNQNVIFNSTVYQVLAFDP